MHNLLRTAVTLINEDAELLGVEPFAEVFLGQFRIERQRKKPVSERPLSELLANKRTWRISKESSSNRSSMNSVASRQLDICSNTFFATIWGKPLAEAGSLKRSGNAWWHGCEIRDEFDDFH